MKHIGMSTMSIETLMNTYIFLHYPGQVRSFIDSMFQIKCSSFKFYQFHLPATRDRAFTELGVRHYVNVDISILEDKLGLDSHMPCDSSMNKKFDECAYDQVTTKMLLQRSFIIFQSIFLLASEATQVNGWYLSFPDRFIQWQYS